MILIRLVLINNYRDKGTCITSPGVKRFIAGIIITVFTLCIGTPYLLTILVQKFEIVHYIINSYGVSDLVLDWLQSLVTKYLFF